MKKLIFVLALISLLPADIVRADSTNIGYVDEETSRGGAVRIAIIGPSTDSPSLEKAVNDWLIGHPKAFIVSISYRQSQSPSSTRNSVMIVYRIRRSE